MKIGAKFAKDGHSLVNDDLEDISKDTQYGPQKIQLGKDPSHIGTINYEFKTPFNDGTYLLAEVPHGYTYLPSGMVQLIWESPVNGDTQFSGYWIVFDAGFDPINFPPFGLFIYSFQIFYLVDRTSLKIYYKQENAEYASLESAMMDSYPKWKFAYEIYAEKG